MKKKLVSWILTASLTTAMLLTATPVYAEDFSAVSEEAAIILEAPSESEVPVFAETVPAEGNSSDQSLSEEIVDSDPVQSASGIAEVAAETEAAPGSEEILLAADGTDMDIVDFGEDFVEPLSEAGGNAEDLPSASQATGSVTKVEVLEYPQSAVDASEYQLLSYDFNKIKARITYKDGTTAEVFGNDDSWEEAGLYWNMDLKQAVLKIYQEGSDEDIILASVPIQVKKLSDVATDLTGGKKVNVSRQAGETRGYYLYTPAETGSYQIKAVRNQGAASVNADLYAPSLGYVSYTYVDLDDEEEPASVVISRPFMMSAGKTYLIETLETVQNSVSFDMELVKYDAVVNSLTLDKAVDVSFSDTNRNQGFHFTAPEDGIYQVYAPVYRLYEDDSESPVITKEEDYAELEVLYKNGLQQFRNYLNEGEGYVSSVFGMQKGETAYISLHSYADTGTITVQKTDLDAVTLGYSYLNFGELFDKYGGAISDILKELELEVEFHDSRDSYRIERCRFEGGYSTKDQFGNTYTLHIEDNSTGESMDGASSLESGDYIITLFRNGEKISSDYYYIPLTETEIRKNAVTLTLGKAVSIDGYQAGNYYFLFTPDHTARYQFTTPSFYNGIGEMRLGVLKNGILDEQYWIDGTYAKKLTAGLTYVCCLHYENAQYENGTIKVEEIPEATVTGIKATGDLMFPFYDGEIQVTLSYGGKTTGNTTQFYGTSWDEERKCQVGVMRDQYGNEIFIQFINSSGKTDERVPVFSYLEKDEVYTLKAYLQGAEEGAKTATAKLKGISKTVKEKEKFTLANGQAVKASFTVPDNNKQYLLVFHNTKNGTVKTRLMARYNQETTEYYLAGGTYTDQKEPTVETENECSDQMIFVRCTSAGGFEGYFEIVEQKKLSDVSFSQNVTYGTSSAFTSLKKFPVTLKYADGTSETVKEWNVEKNSKDATAWLYTYSKNGNYVDLYFLDGDKMLPVPGADGKTPEAGSYTMHVYVGRGAADRADDVYDGIEKEVTVTLFKPVLKLNVSKIPLKYSQSTSVVKVKNMASQDSIKSWKSSDTKIATVNSKGKITAKKKAGTATITVTTKYGAKATVKVTVQKGTVKTTKITGVSKTAKIKKGKKLTLKPVLTPLTSQEKITYKSSNAKVAKVSSSGVITGVKAGTATITVQSGSKKTTIKVTVTK